MARGPKKHLKRIRAPKSWMLDRLGGVFATRPSQGPHKLKESMPLHVILKNKLGYSLTYRESIRILNDKTNEVKIDGKVRRDPKFPVGLMDVVHIPKTGDLFRVFYDERRRFTFLKLKGKDGKDLKEATTKLCKVVRVEIGANKIPYLVTHDARTIRYPEPTIQVGDTILYNYEKGTVEKHYPLTVGHRALVTNGNNLGRIGSIQSIVKKSGNVAVVTLKDDEHHVFNTRVGNIFVIGDTKVHTLLPKRKGIKFTVGEIAEKLIAEDNRDD